MAGHGDIAQGWGQGVMAQHRDRGHSRGLMAGHRDMAQSWELWAQAKHRDTGQRPCVSPLCSHRPQFWGHQPRGVPTVLTSSG